MQQILLAQPRGFCAGVERAIEIVERALALYGAPVYVRHEIVHNQWVVNNLRAKGVVFVEEISEIPDGAITVFSAHGISEKVENEARLRSLPVYLVSSERDVALLRVQNPEKLAYVTQTTLSLDDTKIIIDALKSRFPHIAGPELRDICYATQNRQKAVRELAAHVNVLLVVGSANSSNSNRLRDLGVEMGIASYLIPDAASFNPAWLEGAGTVGVTAGASAPEHLVQELAATLKKLYPHAELCTMQGAQERTRFKLPDEVMEKRFGT